MIGPADEKELHERIEALAPGQKAQVLDFVRSLATSRPRGAPGSAMLRFAGIIPAQELDEMAQLIEEACERIDPDAW